ncbi:MAG: phenylacetate--CoA ligase [Pirellulales bacterium]|nr:phenylacetate--CoA ligase [Pirellulales bacterium]
MDHTSWPLSLTAQSFRAGPSPDFLPPAELRQLQTERLRQTVQLAYDKVPLYRQRLAEVGLVPADVRTLDDLARLPFVTKDDLRDGYPLGLFAVPMGEVVRLHASSGTTGRQVLVPYTRADLGVWTEAMIRTLVRFGVGPHDVVQNAYGYGLFTGGLGVHYAAEAIGATVVPISGGNAERQIDVMRDFGTTVLCSTPSFFLQVADRAQELGVDLRRLGLRVGVFGAEPWSEPMRSRIQQAADIEAFDIYGLAEIVGPGVAGECPVHQGLHVLEDHFFPEIIDPASGCPLPDGEEGELVLTTLSKQAMPMLRYRTGDVTAICPGPCPCGSSLRRILRVSHRSDDLFIVRGVNVYPSQIESALLAVKGTLPHYQIVLTEQDDQERAEVRVEVTPEMFSDRIGVLEELQEKLTRRIRQAAGVGIDVRLVEPRTLARSEGKARRVVDQRHKDKAS